MASARFRDLERRLKKLRKRFLPSTFSPTGDYSERQLDHARGYRLLAHAEIEAFLEDRCRHVANSCLKQFQIDGRPGTVLVNLLAFHLVQDELSEGSMRSLYVSKSKRSIEAASEATTAYNRVLSSNHGIRESNLLRMVLPLGLDPIELDSAWMGTLDSFGANRGEVAHTSIKSQQQINPEDEHKTVEYLLVGLEKLDGLIAELD